ncbi:hypothetical protein BKA61DRAFT_595163 [Leptodontidium sp. MPI-SDFR-AT-0119]|nr:hypothetical protein BKA61DRAFT_595163 [Leptodontidium sp. MPI-SDFR-AT-0119]
MRLAIVALINLWRELSIVMLTIRIRLAYEVATPDVILPRWLIGCCHIAQDSPHRAFRRWFMISCINPFDDYD